MDSEQICRSSGKSLRFIGHESVREILFRRNSSRNPNRRESIRSRKTVYLLGTRSFSSPFCRLTIRLSMDVVNELNKIYRPFYTHQGPISFSLENWLLWNFHPAKSITFFIYETILGKTNHPRTLRHNSLGQAKNLCHCNGFPSKHFGVSFIITHVSDFAHNGQIKKSSFVKRGTDGDYPSGQIL